MTHGFPVPTIDRDEIVNEQLEWLKSHNVWSRGRFGAFKYEVGNADHCFIQVATDNKQSINDGLSRELKQSTTSNLERQKEQQ